MRSKEKSSARDINEQPLHHPPVQEKSLTFDAKYLKETIVELAKTDPEIRTILEGLFANSAGDYDPDMDLSPQAGGSLFFRKLTQVITRDLNTVTQTRSIEIAYWLYDTNPLAKRIVELTRDYILGEGVTVNAQAAEEEDRVAQQQVIDLFWNDPYNNFDIMLLAYVLELGLLGELLLPVNVNPSDGTCRLGFVDPGLINNVLVDPDNVSRPTEVVVGNTMSSQAVVSTETERYKVVQHQDDPNSEWFGRYIPVTRNEFGKVTETYIQKDPTTGKKAAKVKPYYSSCFIFQINKPISGRRGRSDLLSLADWIDSYDQMLFGEVDRSQLMRAFIWDVTATGMSDKQIEELKKRNAAPRPGTVRWHNEKIVWDAVTPDLKSHDMSVGLGSILSYIATGAGLPVTWLNGLHDVNRSVASELGEPSFKRLVARQKYVRYMLTTIIIFVLDQAEIAGTLPKRDKLQKSLLPEPWRFSLHFPEIRARDLSTNSNALLATTQALAIAREDMAIDETLEQEVLKVLLDQLGVDIDLVALRERIEDEPPIPPTVVSANMSNSDPAAPRKIPMSTQVSNSRAKKKTPADSKRATNIKT